MTCARLFLLPIPNLKTNAIANLVRNTIKESTTYDFETLVFLAVQDSGAIKVAEYLISIKRLYHACGG